MDVKTKNRNNTDLLLLIFVKCVLMTHDSFLFCCEFLLLLWDFLFCCELSLLLWNFSVAVSFYFIRSFLFRCEFLHLLWLFSVALSFLLYFVVCKFFFLLRLFSFVVAIAGHYRNPHIPRWLWKIFKFMVLRLLENASVSQKIEPIHFY